MNRRTVVLLLAALLSANLLVWVPKSLALRSGVFGQLQLLVDVRHEIMQNYVEEPDEQELVRQAVRGMISSLQDPYTAYLSPEDLKGFNKQVTGSFSGIGAEITIDERTSRLQIVSPLEDSPAWQSGVMAGDIVLEIDGQTTLDISITEAVERLTGPEGTQVTIKVRRESGQEDTITITRARINIQTVRGLKRGEDHHWDFVMDPDNRVGYVRLTQFTERTAGELRDAIQAINGRGVKGLIVDLRFNPGGLLESAIEVSNMFLDPGQRIVSVKGRRVPEHVEHARGRGSVRFDGDVVVLINGASASASEIVAGAILDNDRGMVVGTRTFGKGSVQQIRGLDDGQGAIKLTNAYYYLPSGRNIHRRAGSDIWGVDPPDGFYVPMTTDQIREMVRIRREGDVLRPAAENNGPIELTPHWIRENLSDPQLAAALEAVVGKIQNGQWPSVGQSGARELAMNDQRETLQRQRELLMERLEEIDRELDQLVSSDQPQDDEQTDEQADNQIDEQTPVTEPVAP